MAAPYSGNRQRIQRGGSTQDIATAGNPAACPQLVRADVNADRHFAF